MIKEIFEKKKETFEKSLSKLRDYLKYPKDDEVARSAQVKAFELAAESFWKMMKVFLLTEKGLEVRSPKDVMRECHNTDIFSEEEKIIGIHIIEGRNLLAHIYEEKLAEEVSEKIPEYAKFMEKILERIQENLN